MRKYLLLAAVAAVTACPAAAQYNSQYDVPARPYPSYRYGQATQRQLIDRLAARIDVSVRSGIISRFEGQRLRLEAERLRQLEYRFRQSGYTPWERRELARRIDLLRQNLLVAERARYGRGAVRNSDDYYDDYRRDQGDDVLRDYDRNDDGWDDRDLDRDDRWDDDRAYPNAPLDVDRGDDRDWDDDDARPSPGDPGHRQMEPGDHPEEDQPGGDGPDVGDLRVGDRAPSGLAAVPSDLRGRYRDGAGVYYRYDDGRILQIDARTNAIRWIGEVAY